MIEGEQEKNSAIPSDKTHDGLIAGRIGKLCGCEHCRATVALLAARDDALEEAARIAEAPQRGQAHGDYSRGRMEEAVTIARNIRALKTVQPEKRTRRLTEVND